MGNSKSSSAGLAGQSTTETAKAPRGENKDGASVLSDNHTAAKIDNGKGREDHIYTSQNTLSEMGTATPDLAANTSSSSKREPFEERQTGDVSGTYHDERTTARYPCL